MGNKELWRPSADFVSSSNLFRYTKHLKKRYGLSFNSYSELHKWSILNREQFWVSVMEFNEILYSKKWEVVIENPKDMIKSRWFVGAKLNFAENLLRHKNEKPAIIYQNEKLSAPIITWTYKRLFEEVARLAVSLKKLGVKDGDYVVGYLPNIPEAIAAMLASASIGAVWSSCSADFGSNSMISRFSQIKPKVLFTTDGYCYGGKEYDTEIPVREALREIPSLEKIIVIPYINKKDFLSSPKIVQYSDFISNKYITNMEFKQLPFDHPIYVVYTSGTTGVPKCVVHSAGGTLLQQLKEISLHNDLKKDDVIYYTTTTGWVLWNWMLSVLFTGATLVIRDGSPFFPQPDSLFEFIQNNKITHFGTSARYLTSISNLHLKPREKFDLSRLRVLMYGGSALLSEGCEFIYRDIKDNIMISSMAGGTEIASCFAIGNPFCEIFAGEIQGWGLGMDCDVFDESGRPIKCTKGELVCKSSFPSQPLHFLNDPGNEKYRAAYFDKYPNIWRHGDFAEVTERNTIIISGRSDATLNPKGVRIGTAEIYAQIDNIDGIADSLVVGQKIDNDERIILFLRLKEDQRLTKDLTKIIKRKIIENCSINHVPAKIIVVKDIPYTKNGKKVEIIVKKIINKEPVNFTESLSNPESLELYKNLPELGY